MIDSYQGCHWSPKRYCWVDSKGNDAYRADFTAILPVEHRSEPTTQLKIRRNNENE